MDIKQKSGLAVGAAVIGVGAALGIGYAFAGTGEQAAQPQAGQGTEGARPYGGGGGGPGGEGGPGGSRGMGNLATALAEKLNLDQSTVAQALQEVMQANRPEGQEQGTPPSTGARPDTDDQDRSARDAALAKGLAEKLGVDESAVTKALSEIRSERQANAPDGGRKDKSETAPSASPSAEA